MRFIIRSLLRYPLVSMYSILFISIGFLSYFDVFSKAQTVVYEPLHFFRTPSIQSRVYASENQVLGIRSSIFNNASYQEHYRVIGSLLFFSLVSCVVIILKKRIGTAFFLLSGVILLIGTIVFVQYKIEIPIVYWMFASILGYVYGFIMIIFLDIREKRFITTEFRKNLSENELNKLLQSSDRKKRSGKKLLRQEITVMFADIRGFTAYSENHDAQKVAKKLTELMKQFEVIVKENHGMVDKFIGDGMMALWGAPVSDKKQATHAVQAAMELQQFIDETEFNIGVGVNTGEAVVGHFGSNKYYEYTAIGDSVNLAARIEQATKQLKKSILLHKTTVEKLKQEKSKFRCTKLQPITVKGKKKKVEVYTLKQYQ